MSGSYGCGCGCSGNGGCGDGYGAVVRRGAHVVPSYGIIPLIVPGIAIAASLTDFTGYNNVNNQMYSACPDYTKAVDAFAAFRERVVKMYGKRPRVDVWAGGSGRKNPNAQDPNLKSERDAQRRLKVLKDNAKLVLQKCKGAKKTNGPMPGEEVIDPTTVALDTPTAAGGNMLLYGGIGLVAVLGLLGVVALAKKKKKAA